MEPIHHKSQSQNLPQTTEYVTREENEIMKDISKVDWCASAIQNEDEELQRAEKGPQIA